MEVEAYLFFYERRRSRKDRRYRKHQTGEAEVNTWTDKEFIQRYRVDKELFYELLPRWCACPWSNKTLRGYAADPAIQLLEGLRWYANGPVLRDVADNYLFDRSTISRAVRKVTLFLNTLVDETIYLPRTKQEMADTAEEYQGVAKFPGCIGCIDGTHVLLKAPSVDEDYYVDRKFNHSLSVQIICNSNLEILHIDPRWPGSTHDSYMLKASGIYKAFEEGRFGKYVLLGDSGYPLRRWLMTPYKDPAPNTPESRFNTAQKVTRCGVERCIGVLKSRFRCLSKSTGELMNSPEEITRIICACAVLHNLCIRKGLPEPVLLPGEEEEYEEEEDDHVLQAYHEEEVQTDGKVKFLTGIEVRKKITKEHFMRRKRRHDGTQ